MNLNRNTGGIDKINNRLPQEDFKPLNVANNKIGIFHHDGNVQVSFKNFDLKSLKTSVMKFPDVRPEKVADIKNRLNNGTYIISDEELAACLIEDASTVW